MGRLWSRKWVQLPLSRLLKVKGIGKRRVEVLEKSKKERKRKRKKRRKKKIEYDTEKFFSGRIRKKEREKKQFNMLRINSFPGA